MKRKIEILIMIICIGILLSDAYQLLNGATFTAFGLATAILNYFILDEITQDLERQKKRKAVTKVFSE